MSAAINEACYPKSILINRLAASGLVSQEAACTLPGGIACTNTTNALQQAED